MKVIHQNLQRMTPNSKVSLEQRSEKKASISEPFDIKKIQTQIYFPELFDITPCTSSKLRIDYEIIEQHRQLQKRLVPEQCVESTVFHTLSRSKLSRMSKKSELSETSPSRDKKIPQFKYSNSRPKNNDYCQECDNNEPLAFSDCYGSEDSNCSCSESDQEYKSNQQEKVIHSSQFNSSKKSQSLNNHPKKRNLNKKPVYVVKKPIVLTPKIQELKLDRVFTSMFSRQSLRKSTDETIIKREKSYTQKPIQPKKQLTPQRPMSAKAWNSNKKVISSRDTKDNLLSNVFQEDPKIVKTSQDAMLVQEQVKAVLNIFKLLTNKVKIADKIYQKDIKERFTSARPLPALKEQKHDYGWGTDQITVLQFKQKKEQFKTKYSEILKHVEKDPLLLKKNNKGYKSKEDINRNQKQKTDIQLKQRQQIFKRKYSLDQLKLTDIEKTRLNNYSKEKSKERQQKKKEKQNKKKVLEELEKERLKIIQQMPKKQFSPDEEKIAKAFQVVEKKQVQIIENKQDQIIDKKSDQNVLKKSNLITNNKSQIVSKKPKMMGRNQGQVIDMKSDQIIHEESDQIDRTPE